MTVHNVRFLVWLQPISAFLPALLSVALKLGVASDGLGLVRRREPVLGCVKALNTHGRAETEEWRERPLGGPRF